MFAAKASPHIDAHASASQYQISLTAGFRSLQAENSGLMLTCLCPTTHNTPRGKKLLPRNIPMAAPMHDCRRRRQVLAQDGQFAAPSESGQPIDGHEKRPIKFRMLAAAAESDPIRKSRLSPLTTSDYEQHLIDARRYLDEV